MIEGRHVELTRMRAAIGRRLQESKRDSPHFYVQTEVEIGRVEAALRAYNDRPETARLTTTAVLAHACYAALQAHPKLNAVWTEEGLLEASEVNLGIAVAVADGLLAPALLDAAGQGLPELGESLNDLVARTRAGGLRSKELGGATFTLSNLGMFDVSAFVAIITPPQVATLATARPTPRLALRDGELVEESRMTVTLSADHRAVDGADAARWLETFKTTIEASHSLLAGEGQEAAV